VSLARGSHTCAPSTASIQCIEPPLNVIAIAAFARRIVKESAI
jgi:hypothetical protein